MNEIDVPIVKTASSSDIIYACGILLPLGYFAWMKQEIWKFERYRKMIE